jgi:hypothetical protein
MGAVHVTVQSSSQEDAVRVCYLLAYALDLARIQVRLDAPTGPETLHFVGIVRALSDHANKPTVSIKVICG